VSEIASVLLNRIHAPELIAFAVKNHVYLFLERHSYPINDFLSEYCMEMVDAVRNDKAMIYEPKVLAVVSSMTNADLQSEVILECMRRTHVPWLIFFDFRSNELDAYITSFVNDTALRLHIELVEQLKLMELKKMILNYGIATFKYH
jgi:hypothetical protein